MEQKWQARRNDRGAQATGWKKHHRKITRSGDDRLGERRQAIIPQQGTATRYDSSPKSMPMGLYPAIPHERVASQHARCFLVFSRRIFISFFSLVLALYVQHTHAHTTRGNRNQPGRAVGEGASWRRQQWTLAHHKDASDIIPNTMSCRQHQSR